MVTNRAAIRSHLIEAWYCSDPDSEYFQEYNFSCFSQTDFDAIYSGLQASNSGMQELIQTMELVLTNPTPEATKDLIERWAGLYVKYLVQVLDGRLPQTANPSVNDQFNEPLRNALSIITDQFFLPELSISLIPGSKGWVRIAKEILEELVEEHIILEPSVLGMLTIQRLESILNSLHGDMEQGFIPWSTDLLVEFARSVETLTIYCARVAWNCSFSISIGMPTGQRRFPGQSTIRDSRTG